MAITGTIPDEEAPRARLVVLLKHFSQLGDDREPWRVMYPLKEVMLLIVCATIAGCDDFDEICAWGRHHLDFPRGLCEFHHGIPCERRLRKLVNRVDPILFGRCFASWVAALWPDRHDLIAIDGKTARCTETDMFGLQPPRHIPTLPVTSNSRHGTFPLLEKADVTADMQRLTA